MTREQEIEKAIYNYSKKIEERMNGIDYFNYENIEHAFIDGIEWADSHPINHWISVEEDLPYNHKELIHSNYTDRVLVSSRNGFSEVAFMCIIEDVWEWNTLMKVSYWMPIPQLPKE